MKKNNFSIFPYFVRDLGIYIHLSLPPFTTIRTKKGDIINNKQTNQHER